VAYFCVLRKNLFHHEGHEAHEEKAKINIFIFYLRALRDLRGLIIILVQNNQVKAL
jgi:hypothetical protein